MAIDSPRPSISNATINFACSMVVTLRRVNKMILKTQVINV
ncbi:MAG: hypothetical protein ACFE9J_10340 [Candidatus Hermodarchaeota archaeon]